MIATNISIVLEIRVRYLKFNLQETNPSGILSVMLMLHNRLNKNTLGKSF